MGWPKETDIPPPWVHTPRWHIVGKGRKLHAAWPDCNYALCWVGPLGRRVAPEGKEKCANCLRELKRGGGE
jgi:hypothetical protein